jgi:hypothetical protein
VSHPDNTVRQLIFSDEFPFGDNGIKYPVEMDFFIKNYELQEWMTAQNNRHPSLFGTPESAAGSYFFTFGGGSRDPAE